MVAFAPGQLGDRGYADNVMEGVNLLSMISNGFDDSANRLDVSFVSPMNLSTLQQSIASWAGNPVSPFVDATYHRRLLVLTEPYMIPLLESVKDSLRSTDEVLLLKVNDDDVRAAADKYGLGPRVHGLNISAAYSVRRYCRHMDRLIRLASYVDGRDINHHRLPYYRLYDPDYNLSRDSVAETLAEELGSTTEILFSYLSNEWAMGIYTSDFLLSVIDAAYLYASAQQFVYELNGLAFAIIDLGSGNAGWDYWLMNRTSFDDTFHTLVIDGSPVPLSYRIYIKRFFGMALASWCIDWMDSPVGDMPSSVTHTGMDYCQDNIPDETY